MANTPEKSAEQKSAEDEVERFRSALGPFVIAAETTRMPMLFTNAQTPDFPIIFANDSFLALYGYPREEVLGYGVAALMARGGSSETLASIAKAFEDWDSDDQVIRFNRKDGSPFWGSLFVTPVLDGAGAVAQHFVSFVDLSTFKKEQEHSKMLIDELNHRVKNTLATVQSVAWQAFQNSSDPATILNAIESRISALSSSHDLLTRENWTGASMRDVVGDALAPFGGAEADGRFRVTGGHARLKPRAVMLLGIALHELATNAAKYGALSSDAGVVDIDWANETRANGDWLVVRWRETGGPAVSPPSRKGYGSLVLERGLAHELGARVALTFPSEGALCVIEVPAPKVDDS